MTLVIIAVAAPVAHAVVAGKDLYLPSVGHGQGQCPGGVCSQWRSDAWIYNPSSSTTATVQVYFLYRDQENVTPPSESVMVAPGETKELLDVVLTVFELNGVYGALRFVSDVDVVVTGRVYDENVVTNKGAGTAGQFFPGLPGEMAIGNGESTDLVGLAQDGSGLWRTNFGFVETGGAAVTVEVSKLDALGATLATKSYDLRAWEVIQKSITDLGGALGSNQRLAVWVTGGSGRALAFASRLDNRTGDPSTVEMWVPASTDGTYQITIADSFGFAAGGELMVSDGKVTTISATYFNWDKVDAAGIPLCRELFLWRTTFSPPVALADFAQGVVVKQSCEGAGDITFTLTLTTAGNLAVAGSVDAVGARFPVLNTGCNGPFPTLALSGGKSQ